MKKIRVLVFPADALNATELHDALSSCFNIEVYGASSIRRHGSFVFKNYIEDLPMIDEPHFYEEFDAVLTENEIDVVIPSHDTVALDFANNRHRIPAKVMVPDSKAAAVCRSKRATYSALRGCSFLPVVYTDASEISSFPVFCKPDIGQGAVGARAIRSFTELADVNFDQEVITEFLPGQELTVDCFTDFRGDLKVVSPRTRNRIQAGVSVSSQSFECTNEIRNMAEKISRFLDLNGLWFFQLKEDRHGQYKLMEVSVRCPGTICVTRALGYNLPLLAVYNLLEIDTEVIHNGYNVLVDRELKNSYAIDYAYDLVYLDYDDTLVFGQATNLKAITFLFQCKNRGIPVVLLTKHLGDLSSDLASHGISIKLFREIYHLSEREEKADMIAIDRHPIFIDNSFFERKKVSERFGCPVFDVSEIEVLIDSRF